MSRPCVGLAAVALLSGSAAFAGEKMEGQSLLQSWSELSGATSSIHSSHLGQLQLERQQALMQYQHIEPSDDLHPAIHELTSPETGDYAFQPVRTESGALTNIIVVRAPIFAGSRGRQQFEKYKDEVLFLGLSSLEDFPLPPPNPYSPKFPADEFVGMFPGFLNMYRDPGNLYPAGVKTVDLSQSDFSLPNVPNFSLVQSTTLPIKYDFIMSGTNQDIANGCEGWSSYAKNWSFAKEAFGVMCEEFGLKGVVVAARKGDQACALPKSCEGLVEETEFLAQSEFFDLVKQSRFLLLPQVHDASPRAATQALAHNVPVFMNDNIIGGWKYLNSETGEFFHDMSNFRENLKVLLGNIEQGKYAPQKYILANAGDDIAGAKFKNFVEENFADRVTLPAGTKRLFPTGA